MNERVKSYLNEQELELQKQRSKYLMEELDFYDKEYTDSKESTPQYPYKETDTKTNEVRYFKKVPISVTEEEYEKIIEATTKTKKVRKSENKIALALKMIGALIYTSGGIVGISILGAEQVAEGLYALAKAAIWGTAFLGFAEVIKLLEDIKRK